MPLPQLPAWTGLHRFEHADGIDLVDCGDFRLFMLKKDNLYNICVPAARKGYSLAKHYADVKQYGYPRAPVNAQTVSAVREPQFGIYKILHHLFRACLDFRFLDVGAFVGDVSIRYANFFRTLGCEKRFACFDPTVSGDLIPFNAHLNGLGHCVTHHPFAISAVDGFITFAQRQGHSDSNHATLDAQDNQNTIMPSMTLSRFVREEGVENAFIKLDTENLEDAILNDVADYLRASVNVVAFEFHAHDLKLRRTIGELFATHVLYDVGYVPRPFCFHEIEPQDLERFFRGIQGRPYGYTDVLAVSKRVPDLNRLRQELAGLPQRPVEYSLVYN